MIIGLKRKTRAKENKTRTHGSGLEAEIVMAANYNASLGNINQLETFFTCFSESSSHLSLIQYFN